MSLVPPLYKAIFDGDCRTVDALLAGRDVNIRTKGDNLLHFALVGVTDAPKPEMIQHLIELGVDVNAKDRHGWTPLHFASRTKSPAADPALSTACVKLLIDAGADVNAQDNEGLTPLHRSVCTNPWNVEMIEVLLAAGAKPTDMFLRLVNAVANPDKHKVLDLLAKYQEGEIREDAH